MTDNFDDLLYLSGLTAQGCWEELDEYDRAAVLRFGQLVVEKCADISLKNSHRWDDMGAIIALQVKKHFGVQS